MTALQYIPLQRGEGAPIGSVHLLRRRTGSYWSRGRMIALHLTNDPVTIELLAKASGAEIETG